MRPVLSFFKMADNNEKNKLILKQAGEILNGFEKSDNPENNFLFIQMENVPGSEQQHYNIMGSGDNVDVAAMIYTFMQMNPEHYEAVRLAIGCYIQEYKPDNAIIADKIIDAFQNRHN